MKVLIVAPYWGNRQHIGTFRIDRFVRWLAREGIQVVLVKASDSDHSFETAWGVEVNVRDPLGIYGRTAPNNSYIPPRRRPNRLRRLIAYLLFNPDPGIVWAKRAARHPLVLEQGRGATKIIASNPPESGHIAAAELATRLQADLIIDMRDGWLDEPARPVLQKFRLRRWQEGKLERKILGQAQQIFVTSPVWKELLVQRLPFTGQKTTVLTNGYPPQLPAIDEATNKTVNRNSPHQLTLLHSGRFTGSRKEQKAHYLLEPLLRGVQETESAGEIVLLGKLEAEDLMEIERLRSKFAAYNWSIKHLPPVPRLEAIQALYQSDGLLLLAARPAPIPSKLFEYIPTEKPILAVTPPDSAVSRYASLLPQLYLVKHNQPGDQSTVVKAFLDACSKGNYQSKVPHDFSEDFLSQIFLDKLGVLKSKVVRPSS